MTVPDTHLEISAALCGELVLLEPGRAVVRLTTTDIMTADARGLVHGGFVFGAADYAAMLAVNDPNVVLGSADVKFSAPVRVGELVEFTANVSEEKGKKRIVECSAVVEDRQVFSGTFTTFVLEHHVLD